MILKRLLSFFAVILITGILIYGLFRLFNMAPPLKQERVTVYNLFTARHLELDYDSKVVKSAEATDKFDPADKRIWACYELTATREISITYLWYYEDKVVYQHAGQAGAGTNCTYMEFVSPQLFPPGNYHIYFVIENMLTDLHMDFSVVGKTG
jgi:hypothetical protein